MKLKHLITTIIASIILTGCAQQLLNPTSGVSVSGVNYSGQEISYILQDPDDRENGAGGENLSPFGGGGTMCCYVLPDKWRPGIKVKVMVYDENGELAREVLTEVLPYVDGKPEKLWAVIYADGSAEAVSSKYDPNHPKWPGKVKGWPVASKEYRLKRIQQRIDIANGDLRSYKKFLRDDKLSEREKNEVLNTIKEIETEIKQYERLMK